MNECDNCGMEWTDEQLVNPIKDLAQRVAPGEPMPSGECLECGALCHPADDDEEEEVKRWVCPECGSTALEICADVWVTLIQSGDGFETEESAINGGHEWNDDSGMVCQACGHGANVSDFEVRRTPPESKEVATS